MRSTFHGIEVSKRGLFAQQSALNTTGHNIANANTEGYTRQRVNMQATTGLPYVGLNTSVEPGLLGTGVNVVGIQRIREEFLDVQLRSENKHFGYWEAKSDGLLKIETIMNEPSDTGLQKVMDQFWQSWQDLSQHPETASTRAVVLQRGIALQETFASLSTSLKEMQRDFDNVVRIKALDINSIAKQISDLNDQIGDVVPHGYQPNDLLDQRDVLIDKLSKMIDVKVTPANDGMVNITIDDQPLVNGRTMVEMQVAANPITGFNDITLGGAAFIPKSGSLAGVYETRGTATVTNGQIQYSGVIPDMIKRLDTLAANLTQQLNDAHRKGMTLTDVKAGSNAPSDIPFFVDADDPTKSPTSASKIMVNPLIAANTNNIAAATPGQTTSTSFEGDGSNALEMSKIKFKVINILNLDGTQGESTSLDDYYRYMIAKLGIESQESQRMEKNSEILTGQVENQRQSVSGVSIDEEMSDMVKYQHAYSASARVMTSMDEILDKVINGMGRVGL
ncbi:flagellar hook-associated protein FlgK [Mesorhizobium sp. M00.F.Ca.ET.186.01.1.1]|nr:flagellar hook-associated protein FlgK [Mesorhizobium sp. M00.F.Ca.ET.186.01.1.1]